ncbi:MAG: cytochrome c family protein [Gammaproteobacteria bacterium]|jgi:hypothetical protein|nr:cytochrome c family protein [Gammaproteobacteria bacterium]
MTKRSWGLFALSTSVGALALASGMATAQQAPLGEISAEVCKGCHNDVYKQWKKSMHAQSTALADPLHGAFYQQEVGDPRAEGQLHQKTQTFPVCLACHAPNAALAKSTKLDAKPAFSEGVNCVSCHTLKNYKGIRKPDGKFQLGIAAYEVSPNELQGPQGVGRHLAALKAGGDLFGGGGDDKQKPNPHLGKPVTFEGKEIPALPMEGNPKLMKSMDACMGCHDQRNNAQGAPLCQTGSEYDFSQSKVSCLSCHMPINNGVADHTMGGGHDKGMLQRGPMMEIAVDKQGDKLQAKAVLKNLLPHSLPTGAPFRNMFLKLTAYNDKGEVVWQSAKEHPAKDDPQAYFQYQMVDDEGKPAMPPVATKIGLDSRLKAHEERVLSYDIPAKGVVLVRGELYYQLVWQVLADKFKAALPENVRAPVLIAEFERKVGA